MVDDGGGSDTFEYRDSRAAKMLRAGIEQAQARGLSVRGAARELDYKSSVVISHMQTGRVPIPLDRAVDIARVVGLPEGDFCVAVLEQRHPLVAPVIKAAITAGDGQHGLCGELELLAGTPLEGLPAEHQRILREVAADRDPGRRWLSLAELPVMALLRTFRPNMTERGLDAGDLTAIKTAVQH